MSWTQKDADQLRELVRKAWENGLQVENEIVDAEFQVIETKGAMTDATKRRLAESGPSASDESSTMKPYAPSSAPAAPFNQEVNTMPQPVPTGVNSIDDWGRTVISFGKYRYQHMSYYEMMTSKDPDHVSYVKWAMARHQSSDGALHDLTSYITEWRLDQARARGSQQILIPGEDSTSVDRRAPT